MIRIPLPGEDNALLLSPRWSTLEPPWQLGLLALLVLVPAGLVIWLYRYELRLVRPRAAVLLLGLRLILIALLWAVAAWQPVVVHETTAELPSRLLIAVDRSASMDVRDPQRIVVEKLRLARALKLGGATDSSLIAWVRHFEQQRSTAELTAEERKQLEQILRQVDELTRSQAARRILTADGLDLLALIAKRHDVGLVGFHERAWNLEEKRVDEFLGVRAKEAPRGTDLAQPLLKALEQAGPEAAPLLGVIVLTDGQHNVGPSPLTKAAELGARRVPIYPVALGARQPPADVAVLEVKAPANVFKDVDTPVEVRVKITGLPAQEIRVALHHSDQPPAKDDVRTIKHDGTDRTYPISFQTRLEKAGTHRVEVKAHPADAAALEVTTDNNSASTMVRVGAEKIRVLLVDGEARWEYHYLATALARDKAVHLERVVFLQPRLGEIAEDKLTQLGNPRLRLPDLKDAADDPLHSYDCIILGDVPMEQMNVGERGRLERYVAERGGTLILVAGKRAMPLEYARAGVDDPIAKLLPISEARVSSREEGFAIALTREGLEAPFMRLDTTAATSAERWTERGRHYWGVVGRAKPGAEALAFVADDKAAADKDAPLERRATLFARQPYGFGRVLYIGIDSSWRWRYRVGDLYHHRFWGQVIRWAAADRLLPAGNRFVRYGSRQPVYRHNETVDITVRLLEETPLLEPDAVARARLVPQGKSEPLAAVPLRAAENKPRLLEGRAADLPPGTYRIELDIPELKTKLAVPPKPEDGAVKESRRDTFVVLPPENAEMFDLATNWTLLQNLAAQSRGAVYTAENAHELIDHFARQVVQRATRDPQRLWQDAPLVWWLLGAFLMLLTLEWIIRKAAGLA